MEQILSTYYEAELNNMNSLAREVHDTLQGPKTHGRQEYLRSVLKVAELNETYTIILGPDGSVQPLASPNVPDIPWRNILGNRLKWIKCFAGNRLPAHAGDCW